MKRAHKYAVVFVTVPNRKVAAQLVQLALKARLAACGNILPGVESHYWWRGQLERSAEALILFKTTADRLKKLENLILKNHPYETPEIVAVRLEKGNRAYLTWIKDSVNARGED